MRYIKYVSVLSVLLIYLSLIIPIMDIGLSSDNKIKWDEPNEMEKGRYFWSDVDDNNIYLYGDVLAQSLDDGNSWNVRYSVGRYEVEDGMIYRVKMNGTSYYGKTLQFYKSENLRKEWSKPVDIFDLKGNSGGVYDIMKISTDLLVYSYDEYKGSWSIKVSKSTDEGKTWRDPIIVASDLSMEDPFAGGVIDFNNRLYLSYYTITEDGNSEIMVIRSDDSGRSWNNEVIVVDEGYSFNPILKTNGEYLYLTYLKEEGICFTRSKDGYDWDSTEKIGKILDFTPQNSYYSMTVSSNMVFVGYADYNKLKGYYELKIAYSKDEGKSWNDINQPTGMDENSFRPVIQISESRLHLVWIYNQGEDTSPENYVWYYRSASIGELKKEGSNDSPGVSILFFLAALILIILFRKR